jgi:hypothetical protein
MDQVPAHEPDEVREAHAQTGSLDSALLATSCGCRSVVALFDDVVVLVGEFEGVLPAE